MFNWIEQKLTNINELSGGIALFMIALLTLGSGNFGVGSDGVTIDIHQPRLEEVMIGTYGKAREEAWALSPIKMDGVYQLDTKEKTFRGSGEPFIEVMNVEILIPVLGEPNHLTGIKSGGDFYTKPNIQYLGTGQYYSKKIVTFDGVNEPVKIQEKLELFLGITAVCLLLIRLFVWFLTSWKELTRPLTDHELEDIEFNNTKRFIESQGYEFFLPEKNVIDEFTTCVECRQEKRIEEIILTKPELNEYYICSDCIDWLTRDVPTKQLGARVRGEKEISAVLDLPD